MNVIKKYYDNLCIFLKSQKGVRISICIGLLGLLLILISDCYNKGDTSTTIEETAINTTDDYRISLEKNLKDLIESVSGAGDTKVMITLSNSEKNVYAEEIKKQSNADGSTEYQSNYITVNSNDGKSALISSIQPPQIMGVVVLCKGGSKGSVKEDIYNIVSSLTGLTADKIFVGQLEY